VSPEKQSFWRIVDVLRSSVTTSVFWPGFNGRSQEPPEQAGVTVCVCDENWEKLMLTFLSFISLTERLSGSAFWSCRIAWPSVIA
jgi:hypothetical protein